MGWEKRGNRSYYYFKKREDGRVRSIYLGRGELAVAVYTLVKGTELMLRLLALQNALDADASHRSNQKTTDLAAMEQLSRIGSELNTMQEISERAKQEANSRQSRPASVRQ